MFCRAFCVCGDVYVVYIVCSVLWIVLFCVVFYFLHVMHVKISSSMTSLAINIKISHFDYHLNIPVDINIQ